MMLWPTKDYVQDMKQAIENGYIPMERLDDAVGRILTMKEKLGLFDRDNHHINLSAEDRAFIAKTQKDTAENSVTLIRDTNNTFPLTAEKYKKVSFTAISHHAPTKQQAQLLVDLLREKGFEVDYYEEKGIRPDQTDDYDLNIYACFSRPFRPIGFLDFQGLEARKVAACVKSGNAKTLVVSFGSPYYGDQYFERVPAYVNAYSMLSCSVEAFMKAATGEIPFGTFSPVKLQRK